MALPSSWGLPWAPAFSFAASREIGPSATVGPQQPMGSRSQRLQSSGPQSALPPQPREGSPAPVTSPSHPGGGKAKPFTRAQGCGMGPRSTELQPLPRATKRRRTREALAPRDTMKARRWVRAAPVVGASGVGSVQRMGR